LEIEDVIVSLRVRKYFSIILIKKEVFQMLIIDVKDSENIDKALKKYKRKYERSGTLKQLRRRKAFVKPSVTRRFEVLKAVYKEEKYGNHND
jgi:small subunit ribosomal protein S21